MCVCGLHFFGGILVIYQYRVKMVFQKVYEMIRKCVKNKDDADNVPPIISDNLYRTFPPPPPPVESIVPSSNVEVMVRIHLLKNGCKSK